MGREIYNVINDMSENQISDCMQTGNEEFLDMFKIPEVKIAAEMLEKYLVEY